MEQSGSCPGSREPQAVLVGLIRFSGAGADGAAAAGPRRSPRDQAGDERGASTRAPNPPLGEAEHFAKELAQFSRLEAEGVKVSHSSAATPNCCFFF